eukprot:4329797-Pyramimonas_sp.AAC.1
MMRTRRRRASVAEATGEVGGRRRRGVVDGIGLFLCQAEMRQGAGVDSVPLLLRPGQRVRGRPWRGPHELPRLAPRAS